MTDITALRAEAAASRAAAAGTQRTALPCGEPQRGAPDQPRVFPRPPEFRAEMVERDGHDYYMVEGYASMTEKRYQMWDVFGPYDEVVSTSAFERTLAAKPDVVFRFNHGGTPMANTNDNKRLELWADALGLGTRAYLNPKRSDVQDLMRAIEDKDVREQSFMFQITDGVWNEDFTEFRINEVDMNRGDVGPVTYGANPNTLIAARAGEFLDSIPQMPALVAREAARRLAERTDVRVETPAPEASAENVAGGQSIRLALAALEVDRLLH